MTDKTAVEAMAEGLFKNPNKSHHPSAQAALDALKANGFAVVPVEPTEAMWDAYHKKACELDLADRTLCFESYRAMIAAAQGGE